MSKPHVVMVGPSLESWGGISAVVNVYRRAGLFDRWPITYIPTYVDGSRWRKARAAITGLAKYLIRLITGRVTLLHVHSASRWGFLRKSLLILPTLAFGKQVIFHLHGAEFINVYDHELGRFGRAYVRFILDRCTVIVVLSEGWQIDLQKISENSSIRVIMNPIDSSIAMHSEPENDCPSLLFLGQLGERKGIYVLLDALAKLDSKLNWNLLVGGNGDLAGVQAKTRELGISANVSILGWVGGERKAELLDACTALVLPSFAEGLPMSILEAMAHGRPVITTPVGGIPDLLEDGVDGILVPPGDSDRLANAIAFVLNSPESAKRMGIAGRTKFEKYFSSDVIVPQVESLYAELGIGPVLSLRGVTKSPQ